MKPNSTALRGIAAVFAFATAGISNLRAQNNDAALREKVAALGKRLGELEDKAAPDRKLERLREENKTKARKRTVEDRRHYKPEELKPEELAEIESLPSR